MFTISPNGNGFYRIKNRATGQFLTCSGNQKGAKMIFTDGQKNNPGQIFKLQEVGDKTYTIHTCHHFVLDVQGANKKKGAFLIQWEMNNGDNQKWRMQDPKDITSSSSDWEGGW